MVNIYISCEDRADFTPSLTKKGVKGQHKKQSNQYLSLQKGKLM